MPYGISKRAFLLMYSQTTGIVRLELTSYRCILFLIRLNDGFLMPR